jgi:serine/threonine protein kinase
MKPFQPAEVLARIEHQLKLARLQRELEQEKAALQKSYELLHGAHQRMSLMSGALSEQLSGMTLDGKYLLNIKLGSGGFGIVYKGLQVALQRPVAVKILRLMQSDEFEIALERFRREGISTCRVRHRNAIEVIDTGVSAEGIPYLVMELLSGRSLHDELVAHGNYLPLARCMEIIAPICEVLAEAHALGVVHRDIKPENIYLHRDAHGEIVKILDFGIASLRDLDDAPMTRLTKPQFVLGTALFMAPERVRGTADIDGRSDVYSVAVMLYMMLCGESPFSISYDDNLKLMMAHLNDAPTPLRQYIPTIPSELEAAVMLGMEKKAADRPTAREFLRGLQMAIKATLE